MSEKVDLVCDYCGVAITEKDHKCPNCGANCSDKIKAYNKQKEAEEEELRQKNIEMSKAIQKQMNAPVKFIFIFAFAIFIFIFIMIIVGFTSFYSNNEDDNWLGEDEEAAELKCSQDTYELYAYTSDSFSSSKTPEGYQKIAFHVSCENISDDSVMITGFDVKLKADDYAVEVASLETKPYEKVVQGKAKYPSLLNNTIESGEKIQGYVGFLVPKDKKQLKLTVKDDTFTIDNPVYKEG